MVWCCDVVQSQVWNVVMRCGMWWCVVIQDVKCGIPSDVEWFDAVLDMLWCGMMVEMQCGMCAVVWNVCCGIVWCAIYIWMWWGGWRGARWNVGVLWNGVPRCGGDLMWIMVRCEMWCDVECCNFRHGVMWNANTQCDIEYGVVWTVVSWYVECYIMQDVESYDVMWNAVVWNCGDEERGTCNVLCDVRCGKWCNVLWCQMW